MARNFDTDYAAVIKLQKQILKRLEECDNRLLSLEAQMVQLHKLASMPDIRLAIRQIKSQVEANTRLVRLQDLAIPFPHRLTVERFSMLSQNEEDGLIVAIFRRAGTATNKFVEIGCGDNGGNSGLFARELGWSGLMVDGNSAKVSIAQRKFQSDRVRVLQAWVNRENINALVESGGMAGDIDLLSIDIDGNDYWIWDALDVVDPRLVVVEYNSGFGPDRSVVVPYDPTFDRHKIRNIYYGASLRALEVLARRKGYRLVAVEPRGVNAFFLRSDVGLDIPDCSVGEAFRLLDKYEARIRHGREGVNELVERENLPLIEVSPEC